MKNLALIALLGLSACGYSYVRTYANLDDPFYLRTVEADRLTGHWFVAASFPAPFEEGCSHQTADLSVLPDGRLGVVNQCRLAGVTRQWSGVAETAGQATSRFGGMVFDRDYWVIGLSRDGRTLLMGTPTRVGGWMLHRDRRVTPEEVDRAKDEFAHSGHDIAALDRMNQR
jgi:apolipoprotein D and lipocalin family protein